MTVMTAAAAVTAAKKKKKVPRKATVVIAVVGLLVCCSLSLRSRLAPFRGAPPSPSSSAALAGTEEKEPGGVAPRQPSLRPGCCGSEEGTRVVKASTAEQNEVEEENVAGGRQEKTDDQGAKQTTRKGAAVRLDVGVAVGVDVAVEDDGSAALPSATAAGAAAAARVPDATGTAAAVKIVADVSDKCWIFMHLQKSGGSTVKEMLTESWERRLFVYDNERWKHGDDFSRTFGNKLASATPWNVMAGGYTEALRRVPEVEDKCQFFTLFRHPIARIVSAYYYCKVLPLDKACASDVVRASNVDLLGFAKHWGNFAVRQFALSFVPADDVQAYVRTPEAKALYKGVSLEGTSGWFQLKAYLERPLEEGELGGEAAQGQGQGEIEEQVPGGRLYEMLQPAQELIKHGYTAVGILEEWNTTLALYDTALDMPGMDWKTWYAKDGKQNVNVMYEELKARTLEKAWTDPELKKYLQLDLLLYEHAVDVFNEQARSHGVLR